jgi:hypothetical protein
VTLHLHDAHDTSRADMLQNHDFPQAEPMRRSNLLRKMWLPMVVIAISLGILAAGLFGVSGHILWVASTGLSGFVMSYTLFALIRIRRRADAMNAKLNIALAKVQNEYRPHLMKSATKDRIISRKNIDRTGRN